MTRLATMPTLPLGDDHRRLIGRRQVLEPFEDVVDDGVLGALALTVEAIQLLGDAGGFDRVGGVEDVDDGAGLDETRSCLR